MRPPDLGEVFQRKYKLLDVLGRGGFAIVYRARQVDVDRDVAIKILLPTDGEYSGGLVGRFMREAKLVASLEDPHTITMFDFGRSESGLLYMVTEFVRGTPLDRLVANHAPLPTGHALHIVHQVAQSLREAHANGILHRDIKPANIMTFAYMDDPYRVKVLDFGVAKSVVKMDVNLTREGAIVGTPRYMSPEQLAGGELTPSSDIYSLGLVLFELLTGRPLVQGKSTREFMAAHLSDTPFSLPETLGAEVRHVLERMVAKRPERRFENAVEVTNAIDAIDRDSKRATRPWNAVEAHADTLEDRAGPKARAGREAETTAPADAQPRGGARLLVGASVTAVFVLLVVGAIFLASRGGDDVTDTAGAHGVPVPPEPLPSVVDEPDPPEPVAVTPSPGTDPCGQAVESGWSRKSLAIGLSEYRYELYVPPSHDGSAPAPLMIAAHPQTMRARRFVKGTGVVDLATERGAILALPEDRRAMAWVRDLDESADFVAGIASELSERYCIDPDRQFGVGFSFGAVLVRHASCKHPDLFTATAMVAYADKPDWACEVSPETPALYVNGESDEIAPSDGARGCWRGAFQPLGDLRDETRTLFGCTDESETWFEHANGRCTEWSCDGPLVWCTLPDAGHLWPGSGIAVACPRRDRPPAVDFPTTELVGRFFDEVAPQTVRDEASESDP